MLHTQVLLRGAEGSRRTQNATRRTGGVLGEDLELTVWLLIVHNMAVVNGEVLEGSAQNQ